MSINDVDLYNEELDKYSKIEIEWKRFKDKTFLITGATGLIGKFLIDLIMYKNEKENLNCKIIAIGRDFKKAKERFKKYYGIVDLFKFYELDINTTINIEEKIDYIIHLASSTHPLQYSNYPISTITANVLGTKNILDLAVKKRSKKVVFASSVEIYGENRGDVEKFDESYLGYIDCNTLRAGYPESKRVGEALCQAYIKENGLDIVIPRFSRIFGPTILPDDSKALSQFINKAVANEDIVLKSAGNQYFSYTYVGDSVSALLYLLLYGKSGEAYNVADEEYNITLKDLAFLIATNVGKNIIFDSPSIEESKGYSTATKAVMDSTKLKEINWGVKDTLENNLNRTIKILKKLKK